MDFSQPTQPNKKDPTIWIILGIAAILVFCAGGAGLGVVISYFNQRSTAKPASPIIRPTPRISQPTPRMNLPTLVPTLLGPTLLPAPSGPLMVEAFDPTTNAYPSLADLAPGWQDSKNPGTQNYSFPITQNAPAAIYLGWCTTTSALLQKNLQYMSWSLVVDDVPIDVKGLYQWDNQESDRICRTSVGLIRQWTDTQHKIVTTMTISQKINDGWNDYPAGDYAEIYEVTVTP
jgi:hypothetical protein